MYLYLIILTMKKDTEIKIGFRFVFQSADTTINRNASKQNNKCYNSLYRGHRGITIPGLN